ncbi:MAG: ammonia channel protein [Actinomycetales bacterium mxb001]|nr:MAG: ammonia channel protein [Actinomycetales bacterium mxb001]
MEGIELSTGDTAWVLMAAALVLLMTPGVAFFYGGMVRAKAVLNMMMMSFLAIGIVTVLWVAFGYSLAFGDGGNGFIGDLSISGLQGLVGQFAVNGGVYPIPALIFAMFQLMFAVLTVALITGAIADRTKFLAWGIFAAVWVTLVYFPVAHWVFDFGNEELGGSGAGWLTTLGVLDFAGGTAVHINAGAAALALVIVIGKRVGFGRVPMKPHSLPFVVLGASLLFFGWFGFNAGSALGAGQVAALAFTNTMVATAAGILGWLLVEKLRDGHATSLGAASGAVAALVAITPACAFVAPWGAIIIGLLAGVICAFAVTLKYRLGYDDSLDVVGVHLVGGIVGCLLIGFFATTEVNELGKDGVLYGGGWGLLGVQALGAFAVMAYSFIITLILAFIIKATIGLRISRDDELSGIDVAAHAESAYELGDSGGGGVFAGVGHHSHGEDK